MCSFRLFEQSTACGEEHSCVFNNPVQCIGWRGGLEPLSCSFWAVSTEAQGKFFSMSSPVLWRGAVVEADSGWSFELLALSLLVAGAVSCWLWCCSSSSSAKTCRTISLPSGAKVSLNVDPHAQCVGPNGHLVESLCLGRTCGDRGRSGQRWQRRTSRSCSPTGC